MHKSYVEASRGTWEASQIEEYLPLVRRIAGRQAIALPPHVDEDDLIGYGIFGLLDALNRFDSSRGVKFESYATWRIRGAIIDGLRTMDWVPHSARHRIKRIQEGYAEVENRFGRAATPQEVADQLNMKLSDLEADLILGQSLSLTSFEEIAASGEGENAGSIRNNLTDLDAAEDFLKVEDQERRKILADAIEKLPEKEKLVVALYYQEELTLKEIGAVMNRSESRISQLHSQAVLRLRGRLSRQKKNLF